MTLILNRYMEGPWRFAYIMKVCPQCDLNCMCCQGMNRENRIIFFINGYQDIAFGNFDAI